MAAQNLTGKILKGINDFADNLQWKGDSILRSNNPINKIGKFMIGEADTGIRGTINAMTKDNKKFTDAVKGAYTHANGNVNWKAVTGTYVGAAAAGRVISGGGLYRDSTGNVNAPIVPFI